MSELQEAIKRNLVILKRLEQAEAELEQVNGLIDDVLHDPAIRGKETYLLGDIQTQHIPALREWFVRRNYRCQDDAD